MNVTIVGTTAMVTWSNPSGGDYAGTVVARVADVVDAAPVAGSILSGTPMLSQSVQVLAVGTMTSLSDPGRQPGPVRYVAWTYDDLGNYSRPSSAGSEIALAAMTGQISFVVDNDTLTVSQAPQNLDLTGTTHMLVGTTLTVTLSVKNTSSKFLQNPKAEVTSITNATFSSSDGTADTFPFRTLGPNMLAPGATVTRDLVFNNVNAGTTVTVNLTFATHPSLYWTYRYAQLNMIDLGSRTLITPAIPMTARGPTDRLIRGRIRPPLFHGGRYFDVPTAHGAVERIDLVTRSSVKKGAILVGEKGNLQSLTSTGAEMIAVIKKAGHRDIGALEVVRLDESLTVNGRLELPFSDDQGFSHPAVTPDGSAIALLVTGGIVMIDIATLTLNDPNPSTPLVELISHGLVDQARSITFYNNGNAMLVLGRRGGEYSVLKRSGSSWAATRFQDTATTAKMFSAQPMADGKIWIATSAGIRVFDPSNDSLTPLAGYPATNVPYGVVVLDGAIWVMRQNRINLDRIAVDGTVQETITVPTGNGFYAHWLRLAK
jgi:hypothetical protein